MQTLTSIRNYSQQNPFIVPRNNDSAKMKPGTLSIKRDPIKLHIKNMVCMRCKMVVQAELDKLGIHYTKVELGEVVVMENISFEKSEQLKIALLKTGLELIHDMKAILVEKIKNAIIELVHYDEGVSKIKYSDYLSEKLNHNYNYLSNLFSEVNGISIKQFIINHKIERIKELRYY